MITHLHTQAMSDALSGANTHSFNEVALTFSANRLLSQTALVYSMISINHLTFSDN